MEGKERLKSLQDTTHALEFLAGFIPALPRYVCWFDAPEDYIPGPCIHCGRHTMGHRTFAGIRVVYECAADDCTDETEAYFGGYTPY